MITSTNWGSESKIEARRATIIEPYYKAFKRKNIPPNTQYWTMCGRCATPQGKLVEGCELDYLTKIGFIKPNQFHGVEISPQTHKDNLKLTQANFYQGMMQFNISKAQNPAIINFDHHLSINEIKGQLIALLNYLKPHKDIMLVINLLKKYRTVNDTDEHIMKQITSIDQIVDYEVISLYEYNGVQDNNTTEMLSVTLVKNN